MAIVEARLKVNGKHFEISVDLDEALKIQKGEGDIVSTLQSPAVYHDVKKGDKPSNSELEDTFGTTDIFEIAKKIITSGEVQKTQEFRDTAREEKRKKIISMLIRNATDQNGNPFSENRISSALSEINYNIDNRPADKQFPEILEKLKKVLPIKLELKKFKLTIPARFTGQIYGHLQDFKESEEWISNGDLTAIVSIPAGLTIEFFDKINSNTHGTIQSEEIKN